MKKEYHVYIAWILFALFMLGILPFGNIFSFPIMIYAIFSSNEVKKYNSRKGNILIWSSVGLFAVFIVNLLLAGMGFYGFVSISSSAECVDDNIIVTVKNTGTASIPVYLNQVIISGRDPKGNPLLNTPIKCLEEGKLEPESSAQCTPIKATTLIGSHIIEVETRIGSASIKQGYPVNCG